MGGQDESTNDLWRASGIPPTEVTLPVTQVHDAIACWSSSAGRTAETGDTCEADITPGNKCCDASRVLFASDRALHGYEDAWLVGYLM